MPLINKTVENSTDECYCANDMDLQSFDEPEGTRPRLNIMHSRSVKKDLKTWPQNG